MSSSPILCPQCGHENRQGARFCSKCRSPLKVAVPIRAQRTNPPLPPADVSPPDSGNMNKGARAKHPCPQCQNEVTVGVSFCRHCGCPLSWSLDALNAADPVPTLVAGSSQGTPSLPAPDAATPLQHPALFQSHRLRSAFGWRVGLWVGLALALIALLGVSILVWQERLSKTFPATLPAQVTAITALPAQPPATNAPRPTVPDAAQPTAAQPAPVENPTPIITQSATVTPAVALPTASLINVNALAAAYQLDLTTIQLITGYNTYLTALPGTTITMVYVSAGPFLMGSSQAEIDSALAQCQPDCNDKIFEDEKPQHLVTLDDYWMMQTEVTNQQFTNFVNDGGYWRQALWTPEGWIWLQQGRISEPARINVNANQPNQPVVGVSWHEADAYARWLTEKTNHIWRLPTEAQWEKAARGPAGLIWPWGNQQPMQQQMADCAPSCQAPTDKNAPHPGGPASVGSFTAGASPYGVWDMAGNVWEWTAEWYRADAYQQGTTVNPQGSDPTSEQLRVLRGGSWVNSPVYARTAHRNGWYQSDLRTDNVGFRLVMVKM